MICEVDARLVCLEKEHVKNWPEELFRFVFHLLLPHDFRLWK